MNELVRQLLSGTIHYDTLISHLQNMLYLFNIKKIIAYWEKNEGRFINDMYCTLVLL